MLTKAETVSKYVPAVAQPLGLLFEHAFQPLLALDERQLSGALAVQVQKIEGEEHELISPAFIIAACGLLNIGTPSAFSAQSSPSR